MSKREINRTFEVLLLWANHNESTIRSIITAFNNTPFLFEKRSFISIFTNFLLTLNYFYEDSEVSSRPTSIVRLAQLFR